MGSDRFVTVASVASRAEAAPLVALLASAGIAAHLAGDEIHADGSDQEFQVQVAEPDAAFARAVLVEHEPPDEGIPRLQHRVASNVAAEASIRREDTDEEERPLTSREKDAQRALLAAAFGLIVPPLEVYGAWLLLKVCASREVLDARGRRRAWLAAVLNLAVLGGLALLVALFVWGEPADPLDRLDLLALEHPQRIIGVWEQRVTVAGGEAREEWEFRADGRLRFRQDGAEEAEGFGTWGYQLPWIYVRFDRHRGIDWLSQGKVGGWRLQSLTATEMTLESGKVTSVFSRKQP
jgi:hypothetical protein